jgi:hypothetical protein
MGFCAHNKASLSSAVERLAELVLSVGAFIRCHSEHEHDHDGAGEACSVCIQLATAQYMLKGLAHIALELSVLFALGRKKPAKILFFCFLRSLTLISIKVQFNT